jgi:hypothetical protein
MSHLMNVSDASFLNLSDHCRLIRFITVVVQEDFLAYNHLAMYNE